MRNKLFRALAALPGTGFVLLAMPTSIVWNYARDIRQMYRHYPHAALVLVLSGLLTTFPAHGDDEVFAVSVIPNEGRVGG